jgi:exodeoxyribonuclease VII small subunit
MSDKSRVTYNEPVDELPSVVVGPRNGQARPELSFEESLRELDEIVGILEAGSIPLEQSLELLRRGMELAARCDSTLARAEATLEQLVATEDGELVARRIAWNDDEDDEDEDSEDGNDVGNDEGE